MFNVQKLKPGIFAVDQQLVQYNSEGVYVCNCNDYREYNTCRHMRFIVTTIFTQIQEKFDNGALTEAEYKPKKAKFDRIMAIEEPAPAFLQEIPEFQKSIRKILSVPRGHLKSIEREGLDADTIIQQLF